MYERFLLGPLRRTRRSVLLLGPRQTGKSTLLRQLQPDLEINLASPAAFRRYAAAPERLEEELRAAPAVRTVFLDEVQRVPALLDVAQVLLDERARPLRFLLSGSSARKLRHGQANLLPGRVQSYRLSPLVAAELGEAFVLDRALAHGMLPATWTTESESDRHADLRSYADTYLREEIQAEALVRDVGGYARLLEHVAAASGRVLNLHALSGDAGVPYETARRYLDVLEDTLVAFRVPAWSGTDRASLVAHPRIFLFDTGVRNALLRRPLDEPLPDERGVLFEHLVAMELHARLGSVLPDAKVSHFRTRHGAEVDFVLESGGETWGIEVKASDDVRPGALSGFEALAARVPKLARRVVVFLGPRARRLGEVDLLPFRKFVSELG